MPTFRLEPTSLAPTSLAPEMLRDFTRRAIDDADDAVAVAHERLNGAWVDGGRRYRYHADETGTDWTVECDAVGDLGRRLLADEPDAYSRWCADTYATETTETTETT